MDAQEWYRKIVNRVKDTFEYRFETFILDVTEKICRIMSYKGITRAKLANKMNISRPAVSRMLNGNPNFTLKRLLLVAEALDYELKVDLEEKENVLRKIRLITEANPMLGYRSCRLGIVNPEIYEMQTRAILETMVDLIEEGCDVQPKIMIPGVGNVTEIEFIRRNIMKIANEIENSTGKKLNFEIGTMIELPRACVTADEIAESAEFFSFGTNDLTQTTLGWSRDDAEGKFLPQYIEKGILKENPFAVIDSKGVGNLMKICVDLGRKTRKDIEIGICGEHGGDPESIYLSHKLGLDYVSCSPFRIPIAKLAAAHAKLKE